MSNIDDFIQSFDKQYLEFLDDNTKFKKLAIGIYRNITQEEFDGDFVVKTNPGYLKDARLEYDILVSMQSVFPVRFVELGPDGVIVMPYLSDNYDEHKDFIAICKSAQLEVNVIKKLLLKGYYNFDLKPDNIRIYNDKLVPIDFDNCIICEGDFKLQYPTSDGYSLRFISSSGKDFFRNIEIIKSYSKQDMRKLADMLQIDNLIHCIAKLTFHKSTFDISEKRCQEKVIHDGRVIIDQFFTNLLPESINLWPKFFEEEYSLDLNRFQKEHGSPFESYFAYFLMGIRKSGMRYIADGGDINNVLYTLSSRLYHLEYLLTSNLGSEYFNIINFDDKNNDICKESVRDLNDNYYRFKNSNKLALMRIGYSVDKVNDSFSYYAENLGDVCVESEDVDGKSFTVPNFLNLSLLNVFINNRDILFVCNELDLIIGRSKVEKQVIFMMIIKYIVIKLDNGLCTHSQAIDRSFLEVLAIIRKKLGNNNGFCIDGDYMHYDLTDNKCHQSLKNSADLIAKKLYSSSSQLNSYKTFKFMGMSLYSCSYFISTFKEFFIRIYNWFGYKLKPKNNKQEFKHSQTIFLDQAHKHRRETISFIGINRGVIISI